LDREIFGGPTVSKITANQSQIEYPGSMAGMTKKQTLKGEDIRKRLGDTAAT